MKKIIFHLAVFTAFAAVFSSFKKDQKTVIIDVAHGGKDRGAVIEGISEEEIVRQISKKILANNQNSDVKIILTRSEDAYSSLGERADFINRNNPDLVISLHANANFKNKERKGAEIFSQNSEVAKALAKKLSAKFEDCPTNDQQNLYILKNSKVPTLLLEVGYITNEAERNFLTSNAGQNEISTKILEFIQEK